MKKELIFKNPNTKMKIFSTHLQFTVNGSSMVLSYKYISQVYINKTIKFSLLDLYKLFLKVPVFIIDQNGYILASLKKETKK
jgi:hypothetical protein